MTGLRMDRGYANSASAVRRRPRTGYDGSPGCACVRIRRGTRSRAPRARAPIRRSQCRNPSENRTHQSAWRSACDAPRRRWRRGREPITRLRIACRASETSRAAEGNRCPTAIGAEPEKASARPLNLACHVGNQVSPACRPLNPHCDDRIGGYLHCTKLRVTRTQQRLRVLVFWPFVQDFGVPAQHDPTEPRPVVLVAIDDDRDCRVLGDVSQPFERRDRSSLRFFVDGHVKRTARERKADRYDVRKCAPVRGGEMGNPLLDQTSAFGLRQHERPQGLALPRSGEECVASGEPPPRAGGPGHIWQLPTAPREEPLVPGERFELPTNGLQNRCSTTELTRQAYGSIELFCSLRKNKTAFATALLPFISWAGCVKPLAEQRQHERRHLPASP